MLKIVKKKAEKALDKLQLEADSQSISLDELQSRNKRDEVRKIEILYFNFHNSHGLVPSLETLDTPALTARNILVSLSGMKSETFDSISDTIDWTAEGRIQNSVFSYIEK